MLGREGLSSWLSYCCTFQVNTNTAAAAPSKTSRINNSPHLQDSTGWCQPPFIVLKQSPYPEGFTACPHADCKMGWKHLSGVCPTGGS